MAARGKGGTWAYRTQVDGLEDLVAKLAATPKAINAALKRAGRKVNTLILQTMRTKVPKKGKKLKIKRRATILESSKDILSGLLTTLDAKIKGKKLRKKKPKKYFMRELQAGQTGLLRKSLGGKVGVNRRTGAVYAMAGPRRKRDGFHGKAWSPWLKKMINVIPSKYAHLVERGFMLKVRGKTIRKIPGRPYVRPSYDENRGSIEGLTAKVLQEELDKLEAKAAAKAATLEAMATGGDEA